MMRKSGNRFFIKKAEGTASIRHKAPILPPAIQALKGGSLRYRQWGKIRLVDIDTPESFRPACEMERIVGLAAKARLKQLLEGKEVSIERFGQDRFGRTLAHLYANGQEIGAVLLKDGLALPYVPGRKKDRNTLWCGGQP